MQGLDIPVKCLQGMQKPNWRTNEGVCSLKHLDAGARVICNGVQYCGFLLLYMFKKDRRPLLVFSNKYNKSNRELITRDFTLLGGTPSHDYLHGKKGTLLGGLH